MALATDKCAKLTFRGKDTSFNLFGEPLKTEANIRDLGITLISDLTWNMHISKKVAKANGVLYLLRRNVSQSVGARIKLGLYKSLVLPIILYGIQCIHLSKASMIILEKLQKRTVKCICGTGKYGQQLRFLNILPLPIHIQILNLLTLSNIRTNFCTSNLTTVTLLQSQTAPSRSKEVFKLPKTRTETARNEFVFRTSRLANSKSTRKLRGTCWTEKTSDQAILGDCGSYLRRTQLLHLADCVRLPELQRKVDNFLNSTRDQTPLSLL